MLVFIVFNAAFGLLCWIGDKPISNATNGDYLDYLYFSIETLSTAGYGDMHPQTHYGHLVSAVELFSTTLGGWSNRIDNGKFRDTVPEWIVQAQPCLFLLTPAVRAC